MCLAVADHGGLVVDCRVKNKSVTGAVASFVTANPARDTTPVCPMVQRLNQIYHSCGQRLMRSRTPVKPFHLQKLDLVTSLPIAIEI